MRRLKRHPESKSAFFKVVLSLSVLALILTGVLVWLVFFTGVFRIERIIIKGNSYLDEEYVRVKSGVESYDNLVTLPAGSISDKLEDEPWVRSASIKKRLFHTVVIELTEREPVALLDCNGAGFALDGNAVAVAAVPLDSFPSLPRVHGGNVSTPRPGARVADRKIRDCVAVLNGMTPALRDAFSMANPFDGRGLVFVAREGFQVVYGSPGEGARKNELLEAVTVEIRDNNRSVEYVDVRVPDSPVIKFRQG